MSRGRKTTGIRAPSIRREQVPDQRDVARQARQRASIPRIQLLRRRQHEILRRGFVSLSESTISVRCNTMAVSRRHGRSATKTWSPTTPRPNGSIHVHGNRGEDPTEPRASAPYPIQPCATSRAFRNSHDDSRGSGCGRFITPLGVMLDENRSPTPAAASAARPAMASPVLSTPSRMHRSSAVDPALDISPMSRSMTNCLASNGLKPVHRAARVTKVHRRAATAAVENVFRQTSSSSSCGAINSAALLLPLRQRTASHGLANQLRRRRPPLHGPRQFRVDGAVEMAQSDDVSK